MPPGPSQLESDPRFPSGPWTGFFLMPMTRSRRHGTDLQLTFTAGVMTGTGRDFIGPFSIDGTYDLTDGKCIWTKHYLKKHEVYYLGFNEGKGIWGTWRIPDTPNTPDKGGFHIWPEGMGDPSQPKLAEEAEPPVSVEEEVEVGEPVGSNAQGRQSLGLISA